MHDTPASPVGPARRLARLPFSSIAALASEARRAVLLRSLTALPGALIIDGTPTDDSNRALLDIGSCLGPVLTAGTTIPGNPLEDGGVYRVEPLNAGQGVPDPDGLLIFSTTTRVFEGHTDGYHNPVPPRFVLLLCVRPDQGGGGSTLLTDAAEAVERLDTEQQALLRDPVFPTLFGRVAVLTAGTNTASTVRFNFTELQRFRQAGHEVDPDHWAAAEALHAHVSDPALHWRQTLTAGDLLVLDNQRAVHAREALTSGSARLLKRVWISDNNHAGEEGA